MQEGCFQQQDVQADLVVVGAGMPGIVAAVQAARLGLSVALINDRGYLGGNASAEIRVNVSGADGMQEFNFYAREGGILDEIRLENLYRNPQGNAYVWDTVLKDIIRQEPNIKLFLEVNVDQAMVEVGKILWAAGSQQDSETRFRFFGSYFLDNTGDGTLGALAGADYRMGREGRSEFDERIAPDEPDSFVLPSTLTFYAKGTGRPVHYTPPSYALSIEDSGVLKHRKIPQDAFHRFHWYYELGGEMDQVKDIRKIIDQHESLVYGIWDYIKNSGKYPAENYDLEYVACIPGKRESRRLVGDHILTEQDIVEQREFVDVVGHGGWSIDLHAIRGFFDQGPENSHIYLNGIYQIPFRCGYSRNIRNLFMAGRNMSTTHVAFGSTRVMGTLCTLGQAVGAAAYLCIEHHLSPRQLYQDQGRLRQLQQLLLKEGHYIPGLANEDPQDLMHGASVTASSVAVCELTVSHRQIEACDDLGLIVPVAEHIQGLEVKVQSKRPTTLTYEVYTSKRRWSYGPDKLILTDQVAVPLLPEPTWFTLPLELELPQDSIFVVLKANADLTFSLSSEKLPGIIGLIQRQNRSTKAIDVTTLKPKQTIWRESEPVCFRLDPKQLVYGPDNVKDGYARVDGVPHLWLSAKGGDQWLQVGFAEGKEVSLVRIFFDGDFNTRLFNIERDYEFRALPSIVKDYDVYCRREEEWVKCAKVRGNYQRVNTIQLDPVSTDGLRFEFLATNGSPAVGIHEIRLY